MESLEAALERGKRDLIESLIHVVGFSLRRAERFVTVASRDLITVLAWRGEERSIGDLSEPDIVRDILATMDAKQIAAALGISSTEVWYALRTFVPRALTIADRAQRAKSRSRPRRHADSVRALP